MGIDDKIENDRNAGNGAKEAVSTGRRNPPLSDTALVLLSTAANRENGSILPPPADLRSRGAALDAVLNLLLARALIEEVPVGSDAECRRRDDDAGRVGLRITAAGCAAIGVSAAHEGSAIPEADRREDDGAASNNPAAPAEPDPKADGRRDARDASDDPIDGTIIWIDQGATPEFPLIDPMADRQRAGADAPRGSSKRDLIIALLSREEGATIDALIAATGWLPHTVRAALSGLRKKGHRIDRQKDGEAGSVYRILPVPTDGAAPPASDPAD